MLHYNFYIFEKDSICIFQNTITVLTIIIIVNHITLFSVFKH